MLTDISTDTELCQEQKSSAFPTVLDSRAFVCNFLLHLANVLEPLGLMRL